MITKKTCLLLGAGASSHLGFPLGGQLKQKMLQQLSYWNGNDAARKSVEPNVTAEEVKSFYEDMLHSNYTSPDAFLEKHPEHKRFGKYLMCDILSKLEDDKKFIDLSGWYQNLISSIQVDDIEQLMENQLSIITFNYDRSIDFKLHKFVQHHYRLSSDVAWEKLSEAIPIIHLHGTLGEYPLVEYGCTIDILQRSESIQIVHEIDDSSEQTKDNFNRATTLLNQAEKVAVFGFGFGEDNVRRLNFFREQEKEERDVCVAVGGIQGNDKELVCEHLKKFGLQQVRHIHFYSCNQLLTHGRNPFADN